MLNNEKRKPAKNTNDDAKSSRLDYCNSFFHGIDKKAMNKLQKLQNAAARIISKRKKGSL